MLIGIAITLVVVGTLAYGLRAQRGDDIIIRHPYNNRYSDAAGTAHYPGWSKEVLKLLYEDRKITASGHETTDTDPGLATTHDDYSLESYILGLNHYQIEMLANLDQVPEAGALVIVTWPKAEGGTGFPARVLAVLP